MPKWPTAEQWNDVNETNGKENRNSVAEVVLQNVLPVTEGFGFECQCHADATEGNQNVGCI